MSVSVIASLRPLQGKCWQHTTAGVLSVQLRSRTATANFDAVINLGPQQRRFQTTNPPNNRHDRDLEAEKNQLPKKNQPMQPQITFRQFAGRALAAGLRSLVVAMSPTGIKTAFKQSPGATTLGIFIPDAELALKYYKRAMDQCAEHGLDPYSDEVLGIRIQTSHWLQKIANYNGCLQVLEGVLADCNKWLHIMEQSVKEGKVNNEGRLIQLTSETPEMPSNQVASTSMPSVKQSKADEDFVPENLWHKRQRLLTKTVGIAIKLGELYADEHVLDPDNSQRHLIWAVETALKEFRRRKEEGVKPEEGDWLSPEQMGGAMESLGRDYEHKNQFHLAIPLFFQALRLCETPCHRPVIMNNLAASFAQHPIFVPPTSEPSEMIKELHDPAMPATRKECLEAAQNWAKNAYKHAKDVTGNGRTTECDEACAVALCNWGDVAAMLGNNDLARKKYKQCIEMAAKFGFPSAVKQAQSGLAKLI
ncbi:TPR repeat-containing protein P27G11.02 [Fusarium austroafricanum]|uniref:TPR repeat-containing protein P27G11.02 n=1 Tax=Fusarium austroafricanum TaxID=2364996 RepID=A0A8H4JUS9_9HYPO|nr:TPR repeat-containing protein P27G11.02 [Fusarium austroafricanum]